MTYEIRNRQAAYSLAENQLQGVLRGFGWVDDGNDGCRVYSTDSATDLEFAIDPGTINVNAQPQEVQSQTITVDPVDPTEATNTPTGAVPTAQWLVFVLDGGGELMVSRGNVAEPRPAPDADNQLTTYAEGRQVVEPVPPDMPTVNKVIVAMAYLQEGIDNSQAFDEAFLYPHRMRADLVAGIAGQLPIYETDPGIQDLQDAGNFRVWYSGTGSGPRGFDPGTDSIFSFQTTTVSVAPGDTLRNIDSFTRGNLDPYSGDTSLMQVGQANAFDGDGWRLRSSGTGNRAIWSYTNDGLDNYFPPNTVGRLAVSLDAEPTEFRFWFAKRRGQGSDVRRNHYIAEIRTDDDNLRFIKSTDADARQVIDASTVTGGIALDSWYEIEVDRRTAGAEVIRLLEPQPDGTETVEAQVTNTAGDTEFDGFGLGYSGQGTFRVDAVRQVEPP